MLTGLSTRRYGPVALEPVGEKVARLANSGRRCSDGMSGSRTVCCSLKVCRHGPDPSRTGWARFTARDNSAVAARVSTLGACGWRRCWPAAPRARRRPRHGRSRAGVLAVRLLLEAPGECLSRSASPSRPRRRRRRTDDPGSRLLRAVWRKTPLRAVGVALALTWRWSPAPPRLDGSAAVTSERLSRSPKGTGPRRPAGRATCCVVGSVPAGQDAAGRRRPGR